MFGIVMAINAVCYSCLNFTCVNVSNKLTESIVTLGLRHSERSSECKSRKERRGPIREGASIIEEELATIRGGLLLKGASVKAGTTIGGGVSTREGFC